MKTVVFMNERIRRRKPDGPVIRSVSDKGVMESNLFLLVIRGRVVGRVIFAPKNSPVDTHEVKSWLELEDLVSVVDGSV